MSKEGEEDYSATWLNWLSGLWSWAWGLTSDCGGFLLPFGQQNLGRLQKAVVLPTSREEISLCVQKLLHFGRRC